MNDALRSAARRSRRRLLVAALASLAMFAASRPGAAEELTVRVRESGWLIRPTATAAFSLDPAIAETELRTDGVAVHGRAPGRCAVTVIGPGGAESILVTVVAPTTANAGRRSRANASRATTTWQSGYDSATGRLQSGFGVVTRREGGATTSLHVLHQLATEAAPGDARNALLAVGWTRRDGARELSLLDAPADVSPLTVEGVTLRGAHWRDGRLELHAGYASTLSWAGFLIAPDAAAALGASYAVARGAATWTPELYWFPRASGGGATGVVAALRHEWQGRDLALRSELGVGGTRGRLGLAFDLEHRHDRGSDDADGGRRWLHLLHRRRDCGALGVGAPPGSGLEAGWTGRTGAATTALSLTARRYDLEQGTQRSGSAVARTRLPFGDGFALDAGVSAGAFELAGGDRLRSASLPLALSWDGRRLGTSAQLRWQRDGVSNRGGWGGRAGLRWNGTALRASGSLDYQQAAPGVEVLLRERPDVAQALTELGLGADSPEELARLLRDDAVLRELGLVDGARFRVDAERWQMTADLAWTPSPRHRGALRVHLFADRRSDISGDVATTLGSVSWTQPLGDAAQVVAGVSRWRSDLPSASALDGTTWQLGLQGRFDGAPSFAGVLGGSVRGTVFRDDAHAGVFRPELPGIAGVEVRVDGERVVRTDAGGAFRVDDLGPGEHRVEVLPPPGGFFTTSSSATVRSGEPLRFGLAWEPARIAGAVRDVSGAGVEGVTVVLSGPLGELATRTDRDGGYAFTATAGDWALAARRDTVPAGYDVTRLAPRAVTLVAERPANADFEVRAQRSLSGHVVGVHGAALRVRLVEAGRTAPVGADGAWVFRDVPPGRFTVAVELDGTTVSRSVDVPSGPAALRGIDLAATLAANAPRAAAAGR